uniref:Uncharacterized protein n=1 Tax=Cacopsylla melanoneura TaxID=428564 RepID=A0A8D9AZX3_9HEMI
MSIGHTPPYTTDTDAVNVTVWRKYELENSSGLGLFKIDMKARLNEVFFEGLFTKSVHSSLHHVASCELFLFPIMHRILLLLFKYVIRLGFDAFFYYLLIIFMRPGATMG